MPKIVDQDERRRDIAQAVWTIIARSGLKGATIRKVADECEMSVGSIQHYFKNQNELYQFSMDLMIQRASERMNNLGEYEPENGAAAVQHVIQMLQQMLPLDQERHTEAQTWLVFSAEAVSNKELQEMQEEMNLLIRNACQGCLAYLKSQNVLVAEIEVEYETERLYALIDGLALHLVFRSKGEGRDEMQEVLSKHVSSLVKQSVFKKGE